MVSLELWGIGATLLVSASSLVISYYSYQGQARMAVREAIEQIEPLELGKHEKIKPILHSFGFGIREDWSTTRVRIRHYRLENNPVAASHPRDFEGYRSEARAELEEFMRDLSYVSDAYFTMEGFDLVFDTYDPVKVSRATSKAMKGIWHQSDAGVGELSTDT